MVMKAKKPVIREVQAVYCRLVTRAGREMRTQHRTPPDTAIVTEA
jgi:hypothetical protein